MFKLPVTVTVGDCGPTQPRPSLRSRCSSYAYHNLLSTVAIAGGIPRRRHESDSDSDARAVKIIIIAALCQWQGHHMITDK